MQKPALFRAIYFELRRGLGYEVSSKELVEIAQHILRAYARDGPPLVNHPDARDSRLFATLPVDKAMNDGGWRILEYEGPHDEEEELISQLTASARIVIEKYLGRGWKNQLRNV